MISEARAAFISDLFDNIAEIGLWEADEYRLGQDGILFQLNQIGGDTDSRAVGEISIEERDEELPVEFLDISLVLAKEIEEKNVEAIIRKLYEINITFQRGVFFLDGGGNLCFEAAFPIVADDMEGALKLFLAVYSDINSFLNSIYRYLLRVIVNPENVSFEEYIVAMLNEASAAAE